MKDKPFTEREKYKKFIESTSYIPNISPAAMARIDLSKYKKAKELKHLRGNNGKA